MLFDFAETSPQDCYKLIASTIVPRPIAWIGSRSAAGAINAAPFSFFNAFAGDPPIIGVGIGSRPSGEGKDTQRNIRATGDFTVNLVSDALAEQMNITAVDFPFGTDELSAAGLTTADSAKIASPRIAESPVALECTLFQIVELGPKSALVLGRVVAMHIRDDAILDRAKHYVDTPALDLVGRMHGGGWYCRTRERFSLPRIPLDEWTRNGRPGAPRKTPG